MTQRSHDDYSELDLYDFNEVFVVKTDILGDGIGVDPMQQGHPLSFTSKALTPKHQLLLIYKKETLHILFLIKK